MSTKIFQQLEQVSLLLMIIESNVFRERKGNQFWDMRYPKLSENKGIRIRYEKIKSWKPYIFYSLCRN